MRALGLAIGLGLCGCAAAPSRGAAPAPASAAVADTIPALEEAIATRSAQLSPFPAEQREALEPRADPLASATPLSAGRCAGVCRTSQEICAFTERLCRLANAAGDEDSVHRCRKARATCVDASEQCNRCNP